MAKRSDPERTEIERERGRRIRSLREGMGLSYEAFAARFDVSKGAIVGWEKGASPDINRYKELVSLGLEDPAVETLGSARQLRLPFQQAFLVELRIGPQRAGFLDVRVELKEVAN
jgi:transcriptional regulator with XRE-family HTH domain